MYLIIHIVNLYTLNNERNQVTKSTTPPTLLIPFYSTKHCSLVLSYYSTYLTYAACAQRMATPTTRF